MRHKIKKRALGRIKKQRKALLKSLSNALISHGKIKTTEAKAKELRPVIEKLITLAKINTLSSQRRAARFLSKEAVKKLFNEIGKNYASRSGGYARIIKISSKRQDQAKTAIIELVK